jgi:hypothetical protein
MTLDGLHQAVLVKSLWNRIAGLDPATARKQAIREIAAEDRKSGIDRRLAAASHPVPLPALRGQPQYGHEPDVRSLLIRKVTAMIARLHRPEPPPKRVRISDAMPATPAPQPAAPSLIERIVDAITEPEREPPTPQAPMIRSPNATTTAQLIVDDPHRSGNDFILENWKRSIQTNNIIDFENRQPRV